MYTDRWNEFEELGISRPLPTGKRRELWDDLTILNDEGDSATQGFVVDCGRQSLKTELTAKRGMVFRFLQSRLFIHKRKRKDYRLLCAEPTEQQAKRILWEDIKKLVPPYVFDSKYGGKISESELFIRSTWGAELWLMGLDRPQRAEGNSWDGVCIDERANHKRDVYDNHIGPLIAARDGFEIHVGTPDYSGEDAEAYKTLSENVSKGMIANFKRYHWPSTEVMHPDKLERFRLTMNSQSFKQEFYGLWIDAPGRAYWEFSKDIHKKPTPFIPGKPILVGCDFNSGYHNWILCQVDYPDYFTTLDGEMIPNTFHLPVFRVFDQIYNQNAATSVMIRDLRDKLLALSSDYLDKPLVHFYGDYSGTQARSESHYHNWQQIKNEFPIHAKAKCFHYQPSPLIDKRLTSTNDALLSAAGIVRVQIDDKCTELLKDLEFVRRVDLFNVNKKTGPRTHASDDLGYTIMQFKPEHLLVENKKTSEETMKNFQSFLS